MNHWIRRLSLVALLCILQPAHADRDTRHGQFISIETPGTGTINAYVAGPEHARSGVLVVHDWFGISEQTKQAVRALAAEGYRAIAVDLYQGRTARNHETAQKLMEAMNPELNAQTLQAGLNYLRRPHRRIATLGFSMGGLWALKTALNDPETIQAVAMVYGGDYDKLDLGRLQTLKSPLLAITGSADAWALDSMMRFMPLSQSAGIPFEFYAYPMALHAYAQPLFNEGKHYDETATKASWLVLRGYLRRHLER